MRESIIVDTDSNLIAQNIKDCFNDEVIVINRPEYIHDGVNVINKIIDYDLSQVDGEYFMQTHSTNPLLTTDTIDKAIEKYFENINIYYSIFGVTQIQTRFYDKDVKAVNHNSDEMLRTQDLEPLYEENFGKVKITHNWKLLILILALLILLGFVIKSILNN